MSIVKVKMLMVLDVFYQTLIFSENGVAHSTQNPLLADDFSIHVHKG